MLIDLIPVLVMSIPENQSDEIAKDTFHIDSVVNSSVECLDLYRIPLIPSEFARLYYGFCVGYGAAVHSNYSLPVSENLALSGVSSQYYLKASLEYSLDQLYAEPRRSIIVISAKIGSSQGGFSHANLSLCDLGGATVSYRGDVDLVVSSVMTGSRRRISTSNLWIGGGIVVDFPLVSRYNEVIGRADTTCFNFPDDYKYLPGERIVSIANHSFNDINVAFGLGADISYDFFWYPLPIDVHNPILITPVLEVSSTLTSIRTGTTWRIFRAALGVQIGFPINLTDSRDAN